MGDEEKEGKTKGVEKTGAWELGEKKENLIEDLQGGGGIGPKPLKCSESDKFKEKTLSRDSERHPY